jgi:hypothetical protein
MPSAPRKQSKTYKVPKRPYEAARLDAELKVRFEPGLMLGYGTDGLEEGGDFRNSACSE